MLTEPVKSCVLLREFPKIFDPELYTTLEETVWTFKVCAVIVSLTTKEPVILVVPCTLKLPLTTVLPVMLKVVPV